MIIEEALINIRGNERTKERTRDYLLVLPKIWKGESLCLQASPKGIYHLA